MTRELAFQFEKVSYKNLQVHLKVLSFCLKLTILLHSALAKSFLSGSVKLMPEMRANGTVLYDGGRQEQGTDVHETDFLAISLALSVNKIAAMRARFPQTSHTITMDTQHHPCLFDSNPCLSWGSKYFLGLSYSCCY